MFNIILLGRGLIRIFNYRKSLYRCRHHFYISFIFIFRIGIVSYIFYWISGGVCAWSWFEVPHHSSLIKEIQKLSSLSEWVRRGIWILSCVLLGCNAVEICSWSWILKDFGFHIVRWVIRLISWRISKWCIGLSFLIKHWWYIVRSWWGAHIIYTHD